ncbi:MAG TPA: dihydrofolate reductase family protein, partial [Saprospiraceae bacterium]|nr:dihydrofolate reductase family protein [Saprospiraceae bacterium]
EEGIGILLVEGGTITIQKFIDQGLFDEVFVLNTPKILTRGIPQPIINVDFRSILKLGNDRINIFSDLKDNKR